MNLDSSEFYVCVSVCTRVIILISFWYCSFVDLPALCSMANSPLPLSHPFHAGPGWRKLRMPLCDDILSHCCHPTELSATPSHTQMSGNWAHFFLCWSSMGKYSVNACWINCTIHAKAIYKKWYWNEILNNFPIFKICIEIKNKRTVTREEGERDTGGKQGKGHQGTCIKDTWTKPQGEGLRVGGRGGWVGAWWGENGDSCTWKQ